VADEKEFQERVQQIGRLIAGLNDLADGKARSSAQELVQLVMELHGAGIERMMEIIFAQGPSGLETIERLGRDRITSGLLVLHGLHPDDLETRVRRTVENLAAQLRKQEVEVQLLEAGQGGVRILAKTNGHACGSTYSTIRSAIEEAVYEAAPEIVSLAIEGLEKDGSGFVSLDQLAGAPAALAESGG